MFRPRLALPLALLAVAACSVQRMTPDQVRGTAAPSTNTTSNSGDEHAGHQMPGDAAPTSTQGVKGIAPGAADAAARLQASPRHAEWAMIPAAPGSPDSIAAYVVFPEAKKNAPVVIVVHEIFGLSTWVKGVADQLAADGFIAIAPDLLSKERGGHSTDTLPYDQARALIRNVTPDKMNAMVAAVAQYGMKLPAAAKSYGVVGYCWGGSASFNHGVFGAPGMKASVVYYGTSPSAEDIAKVKIPVLGLYGENDQRVNATIARADSVMKSTNGTFVSKIYPGAGHGFLRAQDQPANLEAAKLAWPETVAWFKKHLR